MSCKTMHVYLNDKRAVEHVPVLESDRKLLP